MSGEPEARIESLNALTLATHDMGRAVRIYRSLGFVSEYGGEDADFTTFRVGEGFLNLICAPLGRSWSWWGRAIFWVSDVDALYARVLALGLEPEAPPRDAEWHERYFQILDPDGHELSFARPIGRKA